MVNYRQQRGLGFFSLIYNLAVVAIIAYVAILLGPVYFENHAVKESMQSIERINVVSANDPVSAAQTKIRNYLAEGFRMNNVVHVPLENIKVVRGTQGFDVSIAYTVQKHVISNVDFLLDFDNQVTVTP